MFECPARTSCFKALQALNQIRSLVGTAPAELREQPRSMTIQQVIATCSAYRPRSGSDVKTVTKVTLRALGQRLPHLDEEIDNLEQLRTGLGQKVASGAARRVRGRT